MNRKFFTYFVLSTGLLLSSFTTKPTYEYPFQDPSVPIEKRVENLVSLLTLDEKINQMVNNAPAIKRLGIPAYKIDVSVLKNAQHKAHALKMAQQSLVLLKNDHVLSLSKNAFLDGKNGKKVAVVGPNADDKSVLLSNYYDYPSKITTVLEAIRQKIGANVLYEKGINLTDNSVFKPNFQANAFSFNGQTGKRDGDEVVQLYLSHKNTAFKTPIRALKGFQRIHLKAGETQNLTFTLSERDLSEIDASGKSVAMKGDIEISGGGGQVSKANVVGKFISR